MRGSNHGEVPNLLFNEELTRIMVTIIVMSFFKVDFYIIFYNYKKPINVNLSRKLEKTQTQNGFQIH